MQRNSFLIALPHSTSSPNDVKQAPHSLWPDTPFCASVCGDRWCTQWASRGLRGPRSTSAQEGTVAAPKAPGRHLSLAGRAPLLPGAEEMEWSCSSTTGCTRGQQSTSYFTAAFPTYHTGLDFLDTGIDSPDLLSLLEKTEQNTVFKQQLCSPDKNLEFYLTTLN